MSQQVGFKVADLQEKKSGLQAEEVAIWVEAIAEAMLQAIRQLHTWQEVYKKQV